MDGRSFWLWLHILTHHRRRGNSFIKSGSGTGSTTWAWRGGGNDHLRGDGGRRAAAPPCTAGPAPGDALRGRHDRVRLPALRGIRDQHRRAGGDHLVCDRRHHHDRGDGLPGRDVRDEAGLGLVRHLRPRHHGPAGPLPHRLELLAGLGHGRGHRVGRRGDLFPQLLQLRADLDRGGDHHRHRNGDQSGRRAFHGRVRVHPVHDQGGGAGRVHPDWRLRDPGDWFRTLMGSPS